MLFYDSFDDLVKLNIEDDGAIVDANRSVFKELIEKNGYVKDFESKWRTKDGRTILVVENARLVRDKEGNNLYYDGFVINVTDRKMAEMALKESEERYRTIIEAFPEIIMVSDLNSNIIFANEALEQITGITPADYSNQNRKAQIHPDDAGYVKHEMRKLIVGNYKHTSIIENRFIDSVGKIHWFSGIFSKIYINNQMYIQTITRDITNKKIAEDELEKYKNHLEILVKERTEELETANEELNATNEELYYQREELEATLNRLQGAQSQLIRSEKMASLGVLAAGVAHEINNPLNFIQGGASALETFAKENLDEKINEVKQYIDIINEGVHRAAQIVKGLNHYSRTSEKHNTSCNLHTIINNCILMLNNQIKNRVTIEREFTLEPFTISCNEGKLHQAILNLISNAVQSIENKGTIRIKTRKDNKNIQIIIADSGCGISSDNLSKIRDPFFTTKAPGRGTGLGLSITSNIIEEHDGSLDFESELGKGTKVYINLPMK
jgi:PAS domain S-box-containing protein